MYESGGEEGKVAGLVRGIPCTGPFELHTSFVTIFWISLEVRGSSFVRDLVPCVQILSFSELDPSCLCSCASLSFTAWVVNGLSQEALR